MKRKTRLVSSIVIFTLSLVALVSMYYAFYVDKENTEPISFVVGEVAFVYEGSLKNELVVPGENLIITPIKLNNESTILTELRMKIDVTSSVLGVVDFDDIFIYEVNAAWILEADGYYYYRGSNTDNSEVGKYKIPPTVTVIDVISNLELDGYQIRNEHQNETIELTIIFQSKQADYVSWTHLGSQNYDFTTGQTS